MALIPRMSTKAALGSQWKYLLCKHLIRQKWGRKYLFRISSKICFCVAKTDKILFLNYSKFMTFLNILIFSRKLVFVFAKKTVTNVCLRYSKLIKFLAKIWLCQLYFFYVQFIQNIIVCFMLLHKLILFHYKVQERKICCIVDADLVGSAIDGWIRIRNFAFIPRRKQFIY